MAETSTANQTRPVRGVTTPLRQTDPIGTVPASAARIEISFRGPTRSPFVRHPVTTQVTIAARCVLDGEGAAPIERRAVFRGAPTPSTLVIPLSGEQAASLAAVEVWAEPYGHAAVLDARNGRLALGRLRFDRPLGGGPQNHAICEVHVLESVAAFIVGEMSRNVNDPTVQACRRSNEQARELEAESERLRREAANAGFLRAGFLYQTASDLLRSAGAARLAANAQLGYRVHTDSGVMGLLPGGDWDHKPRIAEVWGERNRLGDSDRVYYYDIWSNIHFGYVGRAAGFTLEELLGGSDVQQQLDHGEGDESADKSSVREGYNLYDPTSDAAVSVARLLGVVAAHGDWLLENRQSEWGAQGRR